MNTLKKLIMIVAAVLTAALPLAGCGSANTEAGTLNISMISDITALDPAFAYDGPTISLMLQVTEGILRLNADGSISPHLATDWEQVDDLTYVYNIRDDVTFSDGTPMTMEDVLYSLNRYRDESVGSYLAWTYENVDTIEQTGDWQFTVKLLSPDATWKYVFSTAAGHVISKAFCEAAGDSFGTPAGLVLGTGPYKVDEWLVGSEVRLSANENYWDESYKDRDVKNINFIVMSDDSSRVQALISGQIDLDTMLPSDLIQTVRDNDGTDVLLKPSNDTLLLSMNCEKAPFDDVNVRRAVACCVDKASIATGIVGESGIEATALPMGELLYTFDEDSWKKYAAENTGYAYDLEAAKNWLAQSAYPDGFECEMMVDDQTMNVSIATALESALSEIGIKVKVTRVPQDTLINVEFGGDMDSDGKHTYDMALFEWESDYSDPSGNIAGVFHSAYLGEGGSNFPGYSNSEVDEYLDVQAVSSVPAERTKALQSAMSIIIDEAPAIPLAYVNYKIGYSERIKSGIDILTWAFYIKNIELAD